MENDFIVLAVLAFVAGFVLLRLYSTLGKRPERTEERPQPAQGELPREEMNLAPRAAVTAGGPAGEGLMAIVRADPTFDVEHFVSGGRSAYEMVVGAFAKGDRELLKTLLTPRVFESYTAAITQRETKGEPGPELVRLKSAEIVDAQLTGSVARVTVKFEAELAEGATGVRDARERWTFERDVRSNDPNWRLARVTAA